MHVVKMQPTMITRKSSRLLLGDHCKGNPSQCPAFVQLIRSKPGSSVIACLKLGLHDVNNITYTLLPLTENPHICPMTSKPAARVLQATAQLHPLLVRNAIHRAATSALLRRPASAATARTSARLPLAAATWNALCSCPSRM